MNTALRTSRSLTSRLIIAAGLWAACILGAGGLLLSGVFANVVEHNFDARLRADLENLVATVNTDQAGTLALDRPLGDPRYERAYSGWYWQIRSATGSALRSRSLWDTELPASSNADDEPQVLPGPNEAPIRLISLDVALPGHDQRVTFSVAGTTRDMKAARAQFDQTLSAALAVLGAGLLITVVVQVRYGLRPLRDASRALSAIRTGSRERLEGAFPVEVLPLAEELNALLAQNEQVLERARTHVGNLAHGLKTPLSVLTNSLRELPESQRANIANQLAGMQEQIDRYLARARAAGPVGLRRSRTELLGVIRDIEGALSKIYRERGVALSVNVPRNIVFAGDTEDLQEIVGNLLDNAFKWAKRNVAIAALGADSSGMLDLSIEDDGPGLPPGRRDTVLERGKRLDESTPGTGLGLDIAYELIELYGGTLSLNRSGLGGLEVRVRLPAAELAQEPRS